MKFDFGTNSSHFGRTIKDIPGFCSADRFIILSSVTSDTKPDIMDLIFGLFPGGTEFIPSTAKKTRVLVINRSEVYGSYRNMASDTRTRNVFIHHGIADCDINSIQGDTPIVFHDVDYNIISDQPDAKLRGRRNGMKYNGLKETDVSYDTFNTGVFRDGTNYQKILIPNPEFYEEKDMVLIGDREEDYADSISNSKENKYMLPTDQYMNELFHSTLNRLMDSHTKVYKLNIKIDNLSSAFMTASDIEVFNDVINEVVAQAKWSLEKSGFCGAEILLDSDNGFNISKLSTYMNMDKDEKRFNYYMLCGNLDEMNSVTFYDIMRNNNISIIMTLSYSNVHVSIIDKNYLIKPVGGVDKTDSDVHAISDTLKLTYASPTEYCFA